MFWNESRQFVPPQAGVFHEGQETKRMGWKLPAGGASGAVSNSGKSQEGVTPVRAVLPESWRLCWVTASLKPWSQGTLVILGPDSLLSLGPDFQPCYCQLSGGIT